MTYQVSFDFAPAYELINSLFAFTQKNGHKALELGTGWVRSLQTQIPPSLLTAFSQASFAISLDLLVRQCPNERTADAFLTWLAKLSADEMHDLLAPWHSTLPSDIKGERDRAVFVLSQWNEHYFREIDPAILSGLEREAETKRQLLGTLSPVDLHELVTQGIHIQPTEELQEIVLIPQYHSRPYNVSNPYPGLNMTYFPADALPAAPDDPTPTLLRLTRGLADENRLRILRFLSKQPRTFSEIVAEVSLAKSTVHYHLVLLRAAGLVRLTVGKNTVDYSLRQPALQELDDQLSRYLTNG